MLFRSLAGEGIPRPPKQKRSDDFIAAPLSEQDKLRLSLMRTLMLVAKPWRRCPAHTCRRHRRCDSDGIACIAAPPRARSPKKGQAAIAYLQRALARRRAEVTRPARADDSMSRR